MADRDRSYNEQALDFVGAFEAWLRESEFHVDLSGIRIRPSGRSYNSMSISLDVSLDGQ